MASLASVLEVVAYTNAHTCDWAVHVYTVHCVHVIGMMIQVHFLRVFEAAISWKQYHKFASTDCGS